MRTNKMEKIIFKKIEEIFDAGEKSKYRNKSIEALRKIYAQKMTSYHNYEKRHLSRYTPEEIRKDSNLTRMLTNYKNRKTYNAKFTEMYKIKSKKSLINVITVIDSTNKSLILGEYLVKLLTLKKINEYLIKGISLNKLKVIQAHGINRAVREIIGDAFQIPPQIRRNIPAMSCYTKNWLNKNIRNYLRR